MFYSCIFTSTNIGLGYVLTVPANASTGIQVRRTTQQAADFFKLYVLDGSRIGPHGASKTKLSHHYCKFLISVHFSFFW